MTATLTDSGSQGVSSVAFSPHGQILATADDNGNTDLWDVATRTIAATLADPNREAMTSVAFSPDGKIVATADQAGGTTCGTPPPGPSPPPSPTPAARV